MRDPELSKRIEERIQESTKIYSPRDQIAELLLRNDEFHGFLPNGEDVRFDPEWGRNGKCKINWLIRWGVKNSWNGKDETLAENLITRPEVFFKRWLTQDKIGVLSCGLQPTEESTKIGRAWEAFLPNEEEYIFVRIRSTTKRKDLVSLWGTIEKIQKNVYGYNDREKQTFGRDLCWYDLNKYDEFGKQSLGRIRNLWIRNFPKQSLPPRVTVQKAIERIKEFSFRLTPLVG